MKIKAKNSEELKRSIRFEADTIKEVQKIAALKNVSVSDIVRDYVKKGLTIDSYKKDTDLISEIVKEELKDVLEPQVNRIVKMLMKIGKVSAGAMYSNLNLIHHITDQEHKEFYEMINQSFRLGVDYMKKKDIEIDGYLGQSDEVVSDSDKLSKRMGSDFK